MTSSNFESITPSALETVAGGVDDGIPPDTKQESQPFTTGGSFGSDRRDRFTTGGRIEGGGPFTTGGSF